MQAEAVDIDQLVDHYLRMQTVESSSVDFPSDAGNDDDDGCDYDNSGNKYDHTQTVLQKRNTGHATTDPSTTTRGYNHGNNKSYSFNSQHVHRGDCHENEMDVEEDIETHVESILRGERDGYGSGSGNSTGSLWRDGKPLSHHQPPHQHEEGAFPLEEEEDEEEEMESPPPRKLEVDPSSRTTRSVSLNRSSVNHLLHRFTVWQERRDAKRLQAVYEALLQEQADCPFRPQETTLYRRGMSTSQHRNSNPHDDHYSHNQHIVNNGMGGETSRSVCEVNGVGTFLSRMREAREVRDAARRAEEEEMRRLRSSETWKPGPTIPRPFVLGRAPQDAKSSAAGRLDTFERYAGRIRANLFDTPSMIDGPSVPSGLFSVPSTELLLQHVPQETKLL